MQVTVNGELSKLPNEMTIKELLDHLGYKKPFVAVAINHHCIPRGEFAKYMVKASDKVEILAPMAGG